MGMLRSLQTTTAQLSVIIWLTLSSEEECTYAVLYVMLWIAGRGVALSNRTAVASDISLNSVTLDNASNCKRSMANCRIGPVEEVHASQSNQNLIHETTAQDRLRKSMSILPSCMLG